MYSCFVKLILNDQVSKIVHTNQSDEHAQEVYETFSGNALK